MTKSLTEREFNSLAYNTLLAAERNGDVLHFYPWLREQLSNLGVEVLPDFQDGHIVAPTEGNEDLTWRTRANGKWHAIGNPIGQSFAVYDDRLIRPRIEDGTMYLWTPPEVNENEEALRGIND